MVYWPFAGLLKFLAVLFFLAVAPLAALAQPVVVAALGDSLTQGYGLPPEDGFVPRLEAWLQEQGEDVRLLNAGVSGDTTAGGLARVDWTLTPDVGAMIVTLGGNDLLRGVDPAASRKNLAGILEAAAERQIPVLLVGLPAPGNYGRDYQQAFTAIYPDLAEQYKALLYPNFLQPLAQEGQPLSPDPAYFQSDRIHPNAAGVIRIVEAIGPTVQQLIAEARR